MAKAKGSTAKGKATTVAKLAGTKGGNTRVRRELAAQRRAFGAAGVTRAMNNWGLAAGKKTAAKKSAPKAARGGKGAGGGGRNG